MQYHHSAAVTTQAHAAYTTQSSAIAASPEFDQGAKWPLLFIALVVYVAGRTWKRWSAKRRAARIWRSVDY